MGKLKVSCINNLGFRELLVMKEMQVIGLTMAFSLKDATIKTKLWSVLRKQSLWIQNISIGED